MNLILPHGGGYDPFQGILSSTMNLINSDCPGAKSVTLVAWYLTPQ